MAQLSTTVPDTVERRVALAVILTDAYRGGRTLLGAVSVSTAVETAYRKDGTATFVFYRLPAGANAVQVASLEDPPYYAPVTIPVNLPMPLASWPAFPDRSLEQTNPAQYQQQVALAALRPATAYPFPENATLARGRVLLGGQPLAGATVKRAGGDPGVPYTTAGDGAYVLFFDQLSGAAETVQLVASAAGHPDASVSVAIERGVTVSADIKF